jgi:hypothetical protein
MYHIHCYRIKELCIKLVIETSLFKNNFALQDKLAQSTTCNLLQCQCTLNSHHIRSLFRCNTIIDFPKKIYCGISHANIPTRVRTRRRWQKELALVFSATALDSVFKECHVKLQIPNSTMRKERNATLNHSVSLSHLLRTSRLRKVSLRRIMETLFSPPHDMSFYIALQLVINPICFPYYILHQT